jgi:hypothetical protein
VCPWNDSFCTEKKHFPCLIQVINSTRKGFLSLFDDRVGHSTGRPPGSFFSFPTPPCFSQLPTRNLGLCLARHGSSLPILNASANSIFQYS